ncbi:MAG: wax ester/triacylglycerol synthase family O-acyltransferase [Chloroflexi bacterium]|nr:wax ester/triacylglycerol synthase family O-acyltransferase [Chloroflexota bacterium]
MAREAMSKLDAAWLRMEDPTNLMMINGFFQFAQPLDFARVKDTLAARLLPFKRFRQRVVESRLPMRPPYWETDPYFDIEAHLHRLALPAPADEQALKVLVNDMVSTPLDFSKPLWQIHIIDGYEGGSLLFCRLHHCIADGIALMSVMLSLCDDSPDAPWPEPEPVPARRRHSLLIRRLMQPAAAAFATTRKVTETLASQSLEILANPSRARELTLDAGAFAARLARLTLLLPDPKTLFKGKLGVSKRTAWSQPLPISEVKAIGRVMGGTINDVLLTAVTGALRRYLQAHEQEVDSIEIRAMVPVNLRPSKESICLGNQFGLVVLALPIRIDEPLERLLEVKRRMDDLKESPEALVGYTVLQAMGVVPAEVERLGVDFFAAKSSAVMTNVPGPRQPLYFGGHRIQKIMFWVPQSGRMGLGVSIFSYAGEVVLGVMTDAGLVPDPETIIACFHEEFVELRQLVDVLAEQQYQGDVPVVAASEPDRCHATTRAGQRCKNKAMAGSAYCHMHARKIR